MKRKKSKYKIHNKLLSFAIFVPFVLSLVSFNFWKSISEWLKYIVSVGGVCFLLNMFYIRLLDFKYKQYIKHFSIMKLFVNIIALGICILSIYQCTWDVFNSQLGIMGIPFIILLTVHVLIAGD